jgi:hypothetical protein
LLCICINLYHFLPKLMKRRTWSGPDTYILPWMTLPLFADLLS